MTKQELLSKIATITNATQKGENTATRVGGAMEDIVNFNDAQNQLTSEEINRIEQQLKTIGKDEDIFVIKAKMDLFMNKMFNEELTEDPYELSDADFLEVFGMSFDELFEKWYNSKFNIVYLATDSVPTIAEEEVKYKLSTISTFKGYVKGEMVIMMCPFTIDMLEGVRAYFSLQRAPFDGGMRTYMLFLIEPPTGNTKVDAFNYSDGTITFDTDNTIYAGEVENNDTFKNLVISFDNRSNIVAKIKFKNTVGNCTISAGAHVGSKTLTEQGVYIVEAIYSNETTFLSVIKEA